MRRILISFVATFAVALAVFVLAARGGSPPAAADGRGRAAARADARRVDRPAHRRLQATVRAAPKRADGCDAARRRVPAEGARDRRRRLLHARPGRRRPRARAAPRRPRRADRSAARSSCRATTSAAGLRDARRARRAGADGRSRRSASSSTPLVELGPLRRRPAGRCRRWSTASPTSPPTRACPTSASCTATSPARWPRCARPCRRAARAPENVAYVQHAARRPRARSAAASPPPSREYRGALAGVPGYAGRRGRPGAASTSRAGAWPRRIARLQRVVRPPAAAASYVIALGEAQARRGPAARRRRDLRARAARRTMLQRAAGVNTDVELALFEADHGSPRARRDARPRARGRRRRACAPPTRSGGR